MEGLDVAATEAEARSILENRKQAPVASHVERGEPPQKRKKETAKKAVAKKKTTPAKPI